MPQLIVGVDVPTSAAPGADPVGRAVRAEQWGYDFVSSSDHPVGRQPTFETTTLLTWIAARTTRIGIASRVLGVPFRNPAVLAKSAESLQRLSGGRLVLGLGGGHSDDEIRSLGVPALTPRDKVDGLADAITILRGAWTQDRFDHDGRLHAVHDLELAPKPDLLPPIWLGTYGPRALAVTGRLADGWIPSLGFAPPDRIPAMRDRIRSAAEQAGRSPDAVRCIYNVPVRVDPAAPAEPDLVAGAATDVVEQLLELVALGFSGFNIMPSGPEPERQLQLIAGEVLPPLRARADEVTGV